MPTWLIKIGLILLGLVPSLVWLWYFRQRDKHPEPRRIVAQFFLRGAFSAVLALGLEIGATEYLKISDDSPLIYSLPLLSVVMGAFIEEMSKFTLFRLNLLKFKEFDEPVDGVIYMVTTAVGFAAVENVILFARSNDFQKLVSLFVMRSVTATLLHAVTGALIGYYFVIHLIDKEDRQGGSTIFWLGFVEAVILHAIYNLIIHYSLLNTEVVYTLWLMAGLLVFAMILTSHLTVRLNRFKMKEREGVRS